MWYKAGSQKLGWGKGASVSNASAVKLKQVRFSDYETVLSCHHMAHRNLLIILDLPSMWPAPCMPPLKIDSDSWKAQLRTILDILLESVGKSAVMD